MSTFYRGLAGARRRQNRDAGFTLPELIIAVAISVLIMGAIAGALIVSMDNSGSTQARLTDSSASQVTSAFFTRDVQSSIAFTTYQTPGNGPGVCPDPSADPANESLLLGLYWSGASVYTVVSYWQVVVPAGGTSTTTTTTTSATSITELVREACVNGSTTPSNVVVADEANPPLVTLSLAGPCASTVNNPDCPTTKEPDHSDCTPTSSQYNPQDPNCLWLTTSWVSAVTLSLSEPSSGYQFNLVASPRMESQGTGGGPTTTATTSTTTTTIPTTTTTAGPGTTTTTVGSGTTTTTVGSGTTTTTVGSGTTTTTVGSGTTTTTVGSGTTTTTVGSGTTTTTTAPVGNAYPLALLGTGKSVVSCSGFDEHIVVNGDASIASSQSGSIQLAGGDISLQATQILTGANPPSAALNATPFLGSITETPPPANWGAAPSQSDPYAGLTPPTVPSPGPGGPDENITHSTTLSPGNYGAVSINGSNLTVTLNPGDYASLSTTGTNVNLDLIPGNYIFNGPVTLDAFGGNVTLSPGAYLGGLHIWAANLQITLAPGTYIFGADNNSGQGHGTAIEDTGINDSINGTSGVLLYVSSGAVGMTGFGQSLTLDPESGGPYGSIVLWEASGDTNAINVLGLGVGVAAVGGTIYAPTAVLGSFGAGNSYNLGGLVAAGVSCPGFGYQLTITG